MQFQKASVLIRFKPAQGKKEELISHLVDTANNIPAADTGIEIYLISTTPDDNSVYLYEVFTGLPDKEKYESTPEYAVALRKTKDLTQGEPVIIPLIPQGGKQSNVVR